MTIFISGLLLEEDQSCSFSSNICLESKRVYREVSVMYRILNNTIVRGREAKNSILLTQMENLKFLSVGGNNR